MTGELSILDLFLQASLLVKIVMLILLGMSVVSWTMIIKRSQVLSEATTRAHRFEDRFWSGWIFLSFIKKLKLVKTI